MCVYVCSYDTNLLSKAATALKALALPCLPIDSQQTDRTEHAQHTQEKLHGQRDASCACGSSSRPADADTKAEAKAESKQGAEDAHTKTEGKGEGKSKNAEGKEYSFGFVHIKAVDDAGHDKDVALKVRWIEKADAMVGFVLRSLASAAGTTQGGERRADECEDVCGCSVTLVVTGDHSTPVLSGDHSCEPVPFVACRYTAGLGRSALQARAHSGGHADGHSSGGAAAGTETSTEQHTREQQHGAGRGMLFDEIACAGGPLGRFPGRELMPLLQRFLALSAAHLAQARACE